MSPLDYAYHASRNRAPLPTIANARGIGLRYESIDAPATLPQLLIMGWVEQRSNRVDEFRGRFNARGQFMFCFDNHEIRLTTYLDASGIPDVGQALIAALQDWLVTAPNFAVQPGRRHRRPARRVRHRAHALRKPLDRLRGHMLAIHAEKHLVCRRHRQMWL